MYYITFPKSNKSVAPSSFGGNVSGPAVIFALDTMLVSWSTPVPKLLTTPQLTTAGHYQQTPDQHEHRSRPTCPHPSTTTTLCSPWSPNDIQVVVCMACSKDLDGFVSLRSLRLWLLRVQQLLTIPAAAAPPSNADHWLLPPLLPQSEWATTFLFYTHMQTKYLMPMTPWFIVLTCYTAYDII